MAASAGNGAYQAHSKAAIAGNRRDGAGDGLRTRYLNLGKVALYRVSYSRPSEDTILAKPPGEWPESNPGPIHGTRPGPREPAAEGRSHRGQPPATAAVRPGPPRSGGR